MYVRRKLREYDYKRFHSALPGKKKKGRGIYLQLSDIGKRVSGNKKLFVEFVLTFSE